MKVLAILRKEWADMVKNRMVFFTVVGLPIILALVPATAMLVAPGKPPNMTEQQLRAITQLSPALALAGPEKLGMLFLVNQFLLMLLIVPLAIPMTISTYGIIGEKQERSLEPLLATPIEVWELLMGKSLGATIPGVMITWFAYLVIALESVLLVRDPAVTGAILSPTWLLAMGILAPLFTLLSVGLGIIVSSRMSDPRAAQQVGMIVILPVLALVIGTATGAISLGPVVVLLTALVVAAAAAGVLYLAVKLFGRETILTRWK